MCVNLVSLVCDELKFWFSLKRKPIKIKKNRKNRIKETLMDRNEFVSQVKFTRNVQSVSVLIYVEI